MTENRASCIPMAKQEQCENNVDYFFDREGVVHYEFCQKGQTVNKEYHLAVLKRLRDIIRRKRMTVLNNCCTLF